MRCQIYRKLFTLLLVICTVPAFAEDTKLRYTPEHIWKNDKDAKLHEDWFGQPFRILGEPSLWNVSQNNPRAHMYRVSKMPSFSIPTVVRLVVQSNGSGIFYVFDPDTISLDKAATGNEKSILAKLKKKSLIKIDQQNIRKLQTLIEQSGFWTNRIDVKERKDRKKKNFTLDGTIYVIEFVSNGNYKLVTRHGCWIEKEIGLILEAFATLSKTGSLVKGCE